MPFRKIRWSSIVGALRSDVVPRLQVYGLAMIGFIAGIKVRVFGDQALDSMIDTVPLVLAIFCFFSHITVWLLIQLLCNMLPPKLIREAPQYWQYLDQRKKSAATPEDFERMHERHAGSWSTADQEDGALIKKVSLIFLLGICLFLLFASQIALLLSTMEAIVISIERLWSL